ncbi:MAG TPA: hypothetical protein P5137_14690, partial [Candidatus Brocadiia bacterium]|nr:hypothetical protein [Candidatus Brocadiia bacterium]
TAAGSPAPQKITPISYTFEQPTLPETQHADPGFKKLTAAGSDSRVIWRTRDFGRKPIDIRFTFAEPFHLSQVLVTSYYRRAYGISKIQVFVGDGASERAVAELAPNQPYEVPKGEKPESNPVFRIPCDARDVSSARVSVSGVSYVSLCRVEFLGVPAPKAAEPRSAAPVAKLPPPDPAKPFRLVEQDLDGDGSPDILLENPLAAYVITPQWGGAVTVALDKRSRANLVKPYGQGMSWGGVFTDHMWPATHRSGAWHMGEYKREVLSTGPGKLAVRLSRRGSGGVLSGVTFEKTFSLDPGSAALRADYRVLNDQENVVPVDMGVWIHNGMGSETERWKVFWPTAAGVLFAPQGRSAAWSNAPTRGWLGLLTESGAGLAMVQDCQRLENHYTERYDHYSTVEWRFGRFPIEAGSWLAFTAWAVPFYGMNRVDGVSPAMAGAIETADTFPAAPKTFAFRVTPTAKGDFTFVADARRLPKGAWTKLSEQRRSLEPAPAALESPFPAGPGTWVLRVTALAHGQPVMEMERPVVVGAASGEYAMELLAPRLTPKGASATKAVNLDYHSMDYVTPHTQWARPYAGGKPKALFLPQKRPGVREAIELAQRFDIEPHTSYMSRNLAACLWDLGDYAGKLASGELMPHLAKMLKDNRFDVIVVPGNLWKHMTPWIRDEIVRRVEQEGMGLVLLAPEDLPPALAALVKGPAEPARFKGNWTAAASHFITDGVPFDALPPSEALPYATTGAVLATIADKPLLAAAELGKGRVAVATYVVAGRTQRGYDDTYGGVGLTPTLLQLKLDDAYAYPYWEHHLSLLAKMIYWAARKETAVSGQVSAPAGKTGARLSLVLRNAGPKPAPVEITVVCLDKFGREEGKQSLTRDLASGENRLDLPLKTSALEG